ncbi:MAG: hypothetical protein QGG64_02545 [Candidatus Latescibacteria bacterium]|jgi:hypothetical protein|nr:hypothetical protein [Candidatus Latescibacterota bacterium]
MKKWTTWSLALALTFALWGGQNAQAQDEPVAAPEAPGFVDENGDGIDDNARRRHRRGRRGVIKRRGAQAGIQSLLNETQQAELKALVEGMKESEASHADIRTAVEAKLAEWEIERPERPERPERGLNALLDEAQEAEIKALVESLKGSETSGSDIRAAVDAKLAEWEIERPERPERGLDALLDEDQEAAIKGLVEGMKEVEAPRTDIRAAVDAQLEEWGVERPERPAQTKSARGKRGRRGGFRGFRGRGPAPAPEAPAAETSDAQ